LLIDLGLAEADVGHVKEAWERNHPVSLNMVQRTCLFFIALFCPWQTSRTDSMDCFTQLVGQSLLSAWRIVFGKVKSNEIGIGH
jgi:hypothetical protein